jgi:hypothetical protein
MLTMFPVGCSQTRLGLVRPPAPGIADPQGRQKVQLRWIRAAIHGADLDQDVCRRRLRISDEHVEVAILIEDASVQQFIFPVVATTPPVRLDKIVIGVRILRVFIKIL